METSQRNIDEVKTIGNVVFIHDPQPITLVKKKTSIPDSKWIWRCHIDVSAPDKQVWNFLAPFIHQYDAAVFSSPNFSQLLPIRQFLITPSIDPLSDKNKDLPQETIDKVLEKYHIPADTPIITQISRFDYLKDPIGVIEAYRLVKKNVLTVNSSLPAGRPQTTRNRPRSLQRQRKLLAMTLTYTSSLSLPAATLRSMRSRGHLTLLFKNHFVKDLDLP